VPVNRHKKVTCHCLTCVHCCQRYNVAYLVVFYKLCCC